MASLSILNTVWNPTPGEEVAVVAKIPLPTVSHFNTLPALWRERHNNQLPFCKLRNAQFHTLSVLVAQIAQRPPSHVKACLVLVA